MQDAQETFWNGGHVLHSEMVAPPSIYCPDIWETAIWARLGWYVSYTSTMHAIIELSTNKALGEVLSVHHCPQTTKVLFASHTAVTARRGRPHSPRWWHSPLPSSDGITRRELGTLVNIFIWVEKVLELGSNLDPYYSQFELNSVSRTTLQLEERHSKGKPVTLGVWVIY